MDGVTAHLDLLLFHHKDEEGENSGNKRNKWITHSTFNLTFCVTAHFFSVGYEGCLPFTQKIRKFR